MRRGCESAQRSGVGLAASLVGGEDSRLVEALESYLAAIEQGTPPNRREFLARHAEVASRLEQCLDGFELVRSAAVGFATETLPRRALQTSMALPANGLLGDYQVVGEVGRGGMGVVYEAVQVSLGRRVALKVLPALLAADPRLLERFRVEAQAAAQLHHSNIVPIFSVGCDEGIHYYAMQFIDGPTLADVITELRDEQCQDVEEKAGEEKPIEKSGERSGVSSMRLETAIDALTDLRKCNARTVARFGVQAARALEHAHSLGVVHRDIKPANLMLDGRGHLWVTDFGLARIQEDNGLTLTGDLLGTLRYMSPEQASGRRAMVDHRADLYALGTTLYELLTLRAAVSGRDRHDLIRQIANDEPERPRRIDQSIPRELETVILKAMAKEPSDRYGTAGEMADDLQRFLDDKPILARPPTIIDHATKWARRHRSLVVTGTVLLLITSIVLGISTLQIAKERDRVAQRWKRSDERYRLARQVIDDVYWAMVEKWLAVEPEKAALQQEFLGKALAYYRQFANELDGTGRGQLDSALAHRRIGDIQYRLGRLDEAENAYGEGLTILKGLRGHEDSMALGISHELALQCRKLGHLLQATIRDKEAEAYFRAAVAYQLEASPEFVDRGTQKMLAGLNLDLGLLMAREGRVAEAVEAMGESKRYAQVVAESSTLDSLSRRQALAFVQSIESHIAEAEGRIGDAAEKARLAVAGYREVIEADAERLEARHGLSQTLFRLAWLIGTTEDKAVRDPEAAIQLAREASDSDPNNALYHHRLGALLMATLDNDAAEKEFRIALELIPDSPNALNSLAWILVTGEETQAEAAKEAVALARRAVSESPDTGIFWNTLGVSLYQDGKYSEAIEALQHSMSLRSGGDSFDWFFLAMAEWQRGNEIKAQHWLMRAEAWREQNRPADEELTKFQRLARCLFESEPRVIAGSDGQKDIAARKAAGQTWPRVGQIGQASGSGWPGLSTAAGAAVFAMGLVSRRGGQPVEPPTNADDLITAKPQPVSVPSRVVQPRPEIPRQRMDTPRSVRSRVLPIQAVQPD